MQEDNLHITVVSSFQSNLNIPLEERFKPETPSNLVYESLSSELSNISFFEKTEFSRLVINFNLCNDSVFKTDPIYTEEKGILEASIAIRECEFKNAYIQKLYLNTGFKLMFDLCEKYSLNKSDLQCENLVFSEELKESAQNRLQLHLESVKKNPSQQVATALSDEEIACVEHSTKVWLNPLDPEDQLRNISSRYRVQICPLDRFSDEQYKKIALIMSQAPNAKLEVFGVGEQSWADLSFLRHFQQLKKFRIDFGPMDSLDELQYLPDSLESLELIGSNAKYEFSFLTHFRNLKKLGIKGYKRKMKLPDMVSRIQVLHLNSCRSQDASLLNRFESLKSLILYHQKLDKAGSLNGFKNLVFLFLKKEPFADLKWVGKNKSLQYVSLNDFKVTESLNFLSGLDQLRRLELVNLRSINSLDALNQLPNLEDLVVAEMKHLKLENFDCLKNSSTLKHVWTSIGSKKRDIEIKKYLGYPSAGARLHFKFKSS